MPRRLALVACALVAALVTALAVAPAAGAAGPIAKKPSDAQIAKQGVLRLSDFPAGWKQSKHQQSKPTGIAACKPTELVEARNKQYRAQSPDFAQGDLTTAENSVYVFPKPARAIAYLKPFQAAAAGACLQQGTEKAVKKVSGATVQVQPLDLSSALQGGTIDDAVGYEILATLPQSGAAPVQLVLVAVAVRLGRAVVGYTFEEQGQPLSEIDTLINASLTRLQTALG
jgi:hypothetical protein